MIHDLHRQGLSITAIARKLGCDRKTIRKYLARGLEPPIYKPRAPRPNLLEPFEAYLQERVSSFPELSGRRLHRELVELDFSGSNLDDLNQQFDTWRREIANARTHATTRRIVAEAFAEEMPAHQPLPTLRYEAVLSVERRVSRDGMVSVGGNLYRVPDTARRRILEIQHHPSELRIFEDGQFIACHPILEGKDLRRVDPAHRKAPPPQLPQRMPIPGLRRSLEFYDAVGRRMAAEGTRR